MQHVKDDANKSRKQALYLVNSFKQKIAWEPLDLPSVKLLLHCLFLKDEISVTNENKDVSSIPFPTQKYQPGASTCYQQLKLLIFAEVREDAEIERDIYMRGNKFHEYLLTGKNNWLIKPNKLQ